jgi:RNA polymerase sigma-70 factor (ECF subfamily)
LAPDDTQRAGSDPPADWELVRQVQAGREAAFSLLMKRYQGPVLDFVYRMLGHATDAREIAQDVFVRAYAGIGKPSFRPAGAQFSTWLFQVARHAALDALRWRRRHPTTPLAELEEHGAALPATGPTAARESETRETGRLIADAVAQLPEDQRTALILAEYEGLAYAQIAAVMNCSEKSVETRLYRARIFLRRRLVHLLE